MNEWSPRGTTRTPVPTARAGESLLTHPQTEAEAKRALAVLQAFQTITDAALARLSLDEVLHRLLDLLQAVFAVDSAVVLLPTDEEGTLVVRASIGLDDETALAWRLPHGRGIAGHIAQTRAPLIVDDVRQVDVVRPCLQEHVRSLMGVPLLAGTRLTGVLHVGMRTLRHFTSDELLLLQFVADRLARTIEHARLDAAEQEARERAEEAVRLRDTVLALTSHDLRSPLTAISGHAGIIQQRLEHGKPVDPAWLQDQMTHMSRAARRMGRTIEDLLDIACVQMGESLPLDSEEVDIGALVREAIGEAVALPDTPPVCLAAADEALLIRGDRLRLVRVLHNLLSNALKYSPQKTPVDVIVRREGEAALIAVCDQGVGIPPEELPHICTRFFRASTAAGIRGTGIGLAGSKAIIEQHGGTLLLESVVGAGTTVSFRLPLVPAPSCA